VAKSLKLYVQHLDTPQIIWFRRPDGTLDSLPALRLIAFANFLRALKRGPGVDAYFTTKCVIDTGAHFSIIAEDLWRRFKPGFVTPLPFDALTPPQLRVLTIAGGTFPYTLGELTIQLEDQDGTVLPVTVIAKLTRDGGRLAVPLTLGLRGGFLEGRKLHAGPDATVPFGQAWGLAAA
jgi:hypothetical protein